MILSLFKAERNGFIGLFPKKSGFVDNIRFNGLVSKHYWVC